MPLYMSRPIIPTAITSHSMNAHYLNALLRVKENVESDYKATTATWNDHHPTFKVYVKYAGGNAAVLGGTSGDTLDNDIWRWLDNGTTIRRALMSDPFIAKTKWRNIGSKAGVGRAVKVSSKLQLDGILGREFTKAIYDNNVKILQEEIDKAVVRMLRDNPSKWGKTISSSWLLGHP